MRSGLSQQAKVIRIVHRSNAIPPRYIEYVYYFSLFYAIMGPAVGLEIRLLFGGMLVVLAALCVKYLRSGAVSVWAEIKLPLGCAVSFVMLQVFLHHEPLSTVQPFIIWILTLIIVQSLSLRQDFLHRFTVVAFGIGLSTLPYMQSYISNREFDRVGLDRRITIANPDEFAAWFGFLATYFIIAGLEAKRNLMRMISWLAALGCLYVIGLAVTRGALLAVAIASVIAFRRILRHGFLPVLFLIILGWIIYEIALFERAAAFYAVRGTEETGRLVVWPLAFQRFLSSPLAGVGASKIATFVPGSNFPITPHNSFLSLALASGIIPLVFFVSYWWRAAKGAFRANAKRLANAPFQIPLLAYAFLIVQQGNGPFMLPWVIVILSTALAAGIPDPVHRMVMPRTIRGRTAAFIRRSRKAKSVPVEHQFHHYPRSS
jgi:O-Antigen ligase